MIKKPAFHLPYLRIIWTHHCGNMRQEALKRPSYFQDVLYHHDYAENVVAIVTHQIQYEYYSGNRSVSIEGTALENFSTTDQEIS